MPPTHSPSLTELTVLDAHEDRVWYISWSPDGNHLASCSSDRTVRIWDCRELLAANNCSSTVEGRPATARCVAVLNKGDVVHSRSIRAVEWSPDGRLLACASFDGTTSIWAKQPAVDGPKLSHSAAGLGDSEWTCVSTLEGHESEVKSVGWDSSGQLLATSARDRTVWIWEVMDDGTEFDCVSVLNGHTQDVKMVKWHPTREILASASYDDTVRMWCEDTDDWFSADILRQHKSTVWSIAFNGDGTRLVSSSADMTLTVWQMDEVRQGGMSRPTDSGIYNPDEKPFIWRPVCIIDGHHRRDVYSVDWRRRVHGEDNNDQPFGGELIATASGDDSLMIFRLQEKPCQVGTDSQDLAAAKPEHSTEDEKCSDTAVAYDVLVKVDGAHRSDLNCVRWHPTMGNILATCSDDSTIKIWQLRQ